MTQYFVYITSFARLLHDQAEDYKVQEQVIDKYCEEQGITQYILYKDSAYQPLFLRPNLQTMLFDMQPHNTLIITHKDCLSRDGFVLTLFLRLLQKQEIDIICLDDPDFSPARLSRDDQKRIRQITEYESLCSRINFSKGKAKRLLSGKKTGGVAPIGYQWNDKGTLEVVEEQADLVRELFDLYLQLGSIGKLQQYLEEHNILSPRGIAFSKEALRVILTNEFYIGVLHEKDYRAQGKHQAIIDDHVFMAVESSMKSNRRNKT